MEAPVRRFLAGDQQAFDAIRVHLEPIIQSILSPRKRYLYLDHVDDVRQECWIEVIQKLKYWNAARGTLRSFMYKCVSNCVANYFRRSQYFSRFIASDDLEDRLSTLADEVQPAFDLDLAITNRIGTNVSRHILNRVVIATYLKVFEKTRPRIVQEVARTGLASPREAIFLINQAVVTLRWHCLVHQKKENPWKLELQNVV